MFLEEIAAICAAASQWIRAAPCPTAIRANDFAAGERNIKKNRRGIGQL
jgi:hypothetical protein